MEVVFDPNNPASVETVVSESSDKGNGIVTVTPNPVVDSFRINLGLQAETVTLHNVAGALAKSVDTPEDNTVSVDGLSSGLYILTVKAGDKTFNGKVIVK